EEFFQCAALEVLSLVVARDGAIWAGTGPEGFVYRIDPKTREGRIVYDADESYVWDLVQAEDGRIWAGLGAPAKIVAIEANGTASVIAAIDDNHVVSLAPEPGGTFLAGTEGKGLVLRVDRAGKLRVLYDSPEGEVAAVLAGENGEVWAAAAAPAPLRDQANQEKPQPDSNGDGSAPEDEDGGDMDFLFQVTSPDAGKGVLYRIDANGTAVRFWSSQQSSIFDLAWNVDRSAVLVATGDEGRLYAVDDRGAASLVEDLEETQIVAIERSGEDVLLGTSGPPRLLRVGRTGKDGTYTSQVLDARANAKWGRADWLGEGKVTLEYRTGNTEEPDNTWAEWRAVGQDGRLDAEAVRYFQWRAKLGGDSAVVRRVRISSKQENIAPRIFRVTVSPNGLGFFDDVPEPRPRPLYQSLPGGVDVQYSFDNAETDYPPEIRAPWTRGMRQVRWEAIDRNDEFLQFDLSFRRDDETEWKEFAEEIEGDSFAFSSQGVPDGTYLIRVTASDRRFNPTNEKTAWADSEPFVVDNTPPVVEASASREKGSLLRVKGQATDALSDVVRLEYSVDGADWVDLDAGDGIFDSPRETFGFEVEPEGEKEHSILVRATDLGGNLATTRVLVRR
ncbi:MAG: hypothetical protein KC591_17460, partial [Gemmatimonadetes bacterium]|nr:hypothetical protein [Gemmatimonadota bacterium]